jgi:hypothetical protein
MICIMTSNSELLKAFSNPQPKVPRYSFRMQILSSIISLPSLLWRRGKDLLAHLPWRTTPSRPASPSTIITAEQDLVYTPEDFAVFPPPPPGYLIANRDLYWTTIINRRVFAVPSTATSDTSLYALYRLYEYVLLDRPQPIRNALEEFWRKRDWPVASIPDPKDDDPERYACLAGCTYLLVRAFNARVKLGLDRQMPSLLLPEEAEMLKRRPENERNWEKVPEWAERVGRLERTLVVPTAEGEVLEEGDGRCDPDFLERGVVVWRPHVHFT